jgi:hypothetical protein
LRSPAPEAQRATAGARGSHRASPDTSPTSGHNVKGLTVAPRLPGGRPSLVLVSDNSFAASQFTQFPLLALDH